MKKIICLTILFFTFKLSAQDLFLKVKADLKKEHPEIQLDNKLILINFWSVNDPVTRDMNKEIDKTIAVYEKAKLKGGRKGIIAVLICKDGTQQQQIVTLNKDQVTKTITVENTVTGNHEFSSVVYDAEGKEVYKNLTSGTIFNSIHQLITR